MKKGKLRRNNGGQAYLCSFFILSSSFLVLHFSALRSPPSPTQEFPFKPVTSRLLD